MSRPYDFYGLSYDAQRRIRQGEHDLRKARARAHQNNSAAAEAESLRAANAELVEALRRIVERSQNDEIGTAKVIDMREIASKALSLYGGEKP